VKWSGQTHRVLALAAAPLGLLAGAAAFAQDAPDLTKLTEASSDTVVSLNVMWVFLASFLIFFMQAGFALVEAGLTRRKNMAHTMSMNFFVYAIGILGFYFVGTAIGLHNRYVAGVLLLSLFSGAYMAEIFRGGLAAIPKTQRDAARAIGLTPWQTMRLVILPQAVRLVLPPVAGQLVSLIKDSSLLSVIAISEFTLNAQEVNSFTYSTLESYLPLAVGYLLLTLPLSALSRWLEGRFKYET
jgi:ABC-type amino acid transport system permease subunit